MRAISDTRQWLVDSHKSTPPSCGFSEHLPILSMDNRRPNPVLFLWQQTGEGPPEFCLVHMLAQLIYRPIF